MAITHLIGGSLIHSSENDEQTSDDQANDEGTQYPFITRLLVIRLFDCSLFDKRMVPRNLCISFLLGHFELGTMAHQSARGEVLEWPNRAAC